MLTVILFGTSHKYQFPLNERHAVGIKSFRSTIRELCILHKVRVIAEEMSLHAMHENRVAESVAQQLSVELGLYHQLSDPSPKERVALGIRQDNDIKLDGFLNGWASEQIEAEIVESGRVVSDRIREQCWLRRIQEFNVWPLLFICGADHFTSFAAVLRNAGVNVVEAHQDGEPEM